MNWLLAAFLGFVQGATEFLPVSSTGHLVVLQSIFGVDQAKFGLAFNAALHLGTWFALAIYFGKDLWEMVRTRSRWIGIIVLGAVPAVIAGVMIEDFISSVLERPVVVGVSLIGFSLILWAAERWGKRSRGEDGVGLREGWWVGVAQMIALIPGVSRSGITISAGMLLNLKRGVAAKLAFLLSLPVVLGAGGKELLGVMGGGMRGDEVGYFVIGIISAGVAGYLAVRWLMRFLQKGSLMVFVWYRLVLGVVLLAAVMVANLR